MRRFVRGLALIALAAMLIAACGSPSNQGMTPAATPAATSEPSPEPSIDPSNIAHQWEAKPVLITLYGSPGFTDMAYAWSLMPRLVVYADGTVIVTRYDSVGNGITRSVEQATVSRGELCALLSQIEAHGFLGFDQSRYNAPDVTDNGTTHIIVDAWSSNAVSAYALGWALNPPEYGEELEREPSTPAVPAALAETYRLLTRYDPVNRTPYQPERVGLMIVPGLGVGETATPLWPLPDISLKELVEQLMQKPTTASYLEAILEGQQAADVYALFQDDWIKSYTEDGETYSLAVRPLLPLETWSGEPGWGRFPEFASSPTTTLTCGSATAPVPTTTSTPGAAPGATEETSVPEATPTASSADKDAPLELADSIGSRDEPGQLAFTSAVAVSAQGQVYAADSGNDRLQVFSLEGELLETLPLTSSYSTDMLFLPDGTLLVADGLDNEIEIRAPTGELRGTISGWPAPEKTRGSSDKDVAFLARGADGSLYLAEHLGQRVVILNADGSLREIWKGPDGEPFEQITALEVDAAGTLHVVDNVGERIVRRGAGGGVSELAASDARHIAHLPDGSFYVASSDELAYYGADDSLLGRWDDLETGSVEDLAVAPDGSAVLLGGSFFADDQKAALSRYGKDGAHLASFGTTALQPGQFDWHATFAASQAGDVWLIDTSDDDFGETRPRLVHVDAQGRHLATFDSLAGKPLECDSYLLAALSDQSLLIADSCAGTVTRIDAEGAVLMSWGERGSGAGQFNLIAGVVAAPDEQSLYILDSGQGAVVQLGLDGAEQARWTAGELGVKTPGALAVAPDGTFFLFDSGARRIVATPAQGDSWGWALPDPESAGYSIAVDQERQRVYVGGDDYLYVFDWRGVYLGRAPNSGPMGVLVYVRSDGDIYASSGFQSITVYRPLE